MQCRIGSTAGCRTAFVAQQVQRHAHISAPAAARMLPGCGTPQLCCLVCPRQAGLVVQHRFHCFLHGMCLQPSCKPAALTHPRPPTHLPPAPHIPFLPPRDVMVGCLRKAANLAPHSTLLSAPLLGCSGMDAMARGLLNAARLIEEGRLDGLRRERYSSWVGSQLGRCGHTLHLQVARQ